MKFHLLKVFLWLLSTIAYGQYYNISKFTTKEGLAQNHCRTISKDSRGNIWIGTYEGGLCRYDGQKIRTYTVQEGLPSNFIYDIEEDNEKNIWVATSNGISKFNGRTFTNYLANDTLHIKVTSLVKDQAGKIWFYQESKGIANITIGGDITYIHSPQLDTTEVQSLYVDSNSRVWVGSKDAGIFIYKEGKQLTQISTESGLNSNKIFSFYELKNGEMMIGTSAGVNVYKGGKFIYQDSKLNELSNTNVYSILQDVDETIWLGTTEGSYHFKNNNLTKFGEENGISSHILHIVQDDEKGIWFASRFGLYRLNNEMFRTYTSIHGLTDNMIWSLAKDKQDRLWVCTEKGINVMANEKVLPLKFPAELKDSPNPVLINNEGTVFIGANNSIFTYKNGSFKKYPKVNKKYKEEHYVTGIISRNGNIILGGNKGISIFDGKTFKTFLSIEQLDNYTVNSIFERYDELWIGTNGGGIFIYKEGFGMHQYTLKDGLPNETINVLLSDLKGNIWIGTSGNGVCKIRVADIEQPVVRFEELNLTSMNVYSLAIDLNENIWVGTDRGLNKLSVIENDNIKVRTYTETEGFKTPEVCHNAIEVDQKGNIWIGTVDGLIEVKPNKTIYDDITPITYFTGLKLFFKDAFWEDFSDGINNWTGMPLNLDLPSTENHLAFNFVGVSLNMPEKVTYQWKLNGLEKDWSPPSLRGEAIYPNLSPGSYELLVKSCNADGYCGEPITYKFKISMPFYRTKLFIFFGIVSFIGITYYLFRMRMVTLIKDQIKLQKKVKERTAEIEAQKAEIQAQSEKMEEVMNEVDKQNQKLKTINQDALNSVTYAKKIQDVIIYADKNFTEFFNEAFVYALPRNIVSSDFYWVKESKDFKYIILADCTGYGIPGALLSMIGFQFLTQVMSRKKDIDPASILHKLHLKLLKSLKSTKANNLSDGIDLSICKINKNTNTLTYSGARRPILYIQNGEQHFIKGNFCSTGIDFQGVTPEFQNYDIKLTEDTVVYLFSDGFSNQFGGPENKKYKISSFRELLHSIHTLTPLEQKDVLRKEFESWVKDAQQQDDVLVLGFKYYNKEANKVETQVQEQQNGTQS